MDNTFSVYNWNSEPTQEFIIFTEFDFEMTKRSITLEMDC